MYKMLIKEQEKKVFMSLREKFIIDLNKEIEKNRFEKQEKILRKKLREKLEKGLLF